ncbi:Extended synaptotagmin-3 [Basidiobolus ranarum]|uniref:Extended synaptotagmin-3 n=1 Tax=Basidiobolus ranarum TaxID=34480 RepID=A0ABR2WWP6_9FUNG
MPAFIEVTVVEGIELKNPVSDGDIKPSLRLYTSNNFFKKAKTSTLDHDKRYIWNESFEFNFDKKHDKLYVELFDRSHIRRSYSKLGVTVVDVHDIKQERDIDDWYTLSNQEGDQVGRVHLRMNYKL